LSVDLLQVTGLTYTYPNAAQPALSELSFSVRSGECLCLAGNSGCGKSTLLLALMGLLSDGAMSGTVTLSCDAGSGAPGAGIVFQNPEAQILCSTVLEEVAFGPENFCVPPDEIVSRAREALRAVGLEDKEGRNVERFSAGQKQRLAIASVLSMQPKLLFMDEPTSQLDREGKERLLHLLTDLKRQGYTLVISEHDPRPFVGLIDRYLLLEGGRQHALHSSLPDPAQYEVKKVPPEPVAAAEDGPVVLLGGLRLAYPETGEVLKGVDLRIVKGERVHLFGHNGAGKSTLLRCLCGLERPTSGSVSVVGATPRPEKLPGRVGVLFQNPARQLFADSVREEVVFTLTRLGYRAPDAERLVHEALVTCGISHLAERAPLTLSFGEQHRVALAAVLAPRPQLLLLDEPFAGLDFPQRLALLDILAGLPLRYGATVLIASHDELPDQRWADRRYLLREGTLVETCA
jgi:energy-coupling factor transport system ATP-binding protein